MPINLVDQVIKSLCNQLFPPRCVLCQHPGMLGLDLCAPCFALFSGAPKPLPCWHGTVYAGFAYQAFVDELIQGFKFHEQLGFGRLLATLALPALVGENPMALIPVPLHPQRLRQRGYNQALELATCWGKQTGIAVLSRNLQRVRATHVQSGLKASERLPNVSGAFLANGILPAHVALVDDVYTTGATCHAAAEALRAQGVKRVDVWCLARVV